MNTYKNNVKTPEFGINVKSLTVWSPLPNVWFHLLITIFGANVTLRREQEPNLLVGSAENGG